MPAKLGSTAFGFFIISGFVLLWIIISIIPGLGIIGDLIFRFTLGIKFWEFTWPKISFWPPWNILRIIPDIILNLLSAILPYLIDIIPILGPVLNFIHFWSKGYF